MSTRCHIAIYESEEDAKADKHHTLLYNHSDGYPDGVLPILEPFLKQFKEERGMGDTEYLAAWTLHALMDDTVQYTLSAKKEGRCKYAPENGMTGCGFGICTGMHGDIEYLYKIYPDALEVWEVDGRGEDQETKLIQTIAI